MRPGNLIGGVVAGLGLKEKEPSSKFFGNWTWEFPEISDEKWEAIRPSLEERITSLYRKGLIRYGSW
jgi:hypothetical protein